MASPSNAESGSEPEASRSLADRLATVARVIRVAFLFAVVAYTLVPVAGVALGVVPFEPPAPTPYFAFVGLAVVGTGAFVAAAMLDV